LLVGTWRSTTGQEEYLVFAKDGVFDMMDSSRESLQSKMQSEYDGELQWKYEIVTEVEPHQLYNVLTVDDRSEKMPMGIFKVEGNKLIIRQSTEIHRTLGGFDMGVLRYEIPEDFSGVLNVYEKVR